ncbi:hypothetical protein QTG56_01940 [Rossellomorea sp. AcN35-11]|nr:hypothetical protein [Rossellomorea aquimaris]WJV29949.1 hypothetical protein QTG56_01940 [Rossellomorea sp. AcN35-11]
MEGFIFLGGVAAQSGVLADTKVRLSIISWSVILKGKMEAEIRVADPLPELIDPFWRRFNPEIR